MKWLFWTGLLIVAIVSLFIYLNNSGDVIVTVEREVIELEAELADIEAAVTAGTLSPEEAADAYAIVAARLETINAVVATGGADTLSVGQRATLQAGLVKLKVVLTDYQATLLVVDAQVDELPAAVQKQVRSSGNGKRLTSTAVAVTINAETAVGTDDTTSLEEIYETNASSSQALSEVWLAELASSTDAGVSSETTPELDDTASSSLDMLATSSTATSTAPEEMDSDSGTSTAQ